MVSSWAMLLRSKSSTKISTIGALQNHAIATLKSHRAKKTLKTSYSLERGHFDVTLTAAAVRFTYGSREHGFILFLDHTGFVSICAKKSFLKTIEDAEKCGTPTVLVKLGGVVQFRWSNSSSNAEDEVFFSLNDKATAVPEECTSSKDVCTSFGSLLSLCRNPLSAGFSMPAIMGEIVLRQTHEDELETVLSLEDPTGYALVRLLNCSAENLPKALGDFIIVGKMKFSTCELAGVDMVTTHVDFADVKVIPVSDVTKDERNRRFSSTKIEEYQFPSPLLLKSRD